MIGDRNEAGARATAAAIGPARARPAASTSRTRPRWSAMFDLAVREFGRVDVVVANAAILIAERDRDSPMPQRWHDVLDVNLFGCFLTAKHACRVMKPRRSGAIVNISSKSGKRGSAANSAYSASKFGEIGLTQSVALEMAPFGDPLQRRLPGQPARLAAVDRSGARAARAVPARRQGAGRDRPSRTCARPTSTRCRCGAAAATTTSATRSSSSPPTGPSYITGVALERHRRAGDELTDSERDDRAVHRLDDPARAREVVVLELGRRA